MRADNYREIAGHLYPSFQPDDGIPWLEIERVETAKNFTLPKTLRDFYLLVGNHEPINYSFNRLIGVEQLEIEAGKLFFYQENQGVCDWAIDESDLAQAGPPVWQGQRIHSPTEIDWYSEEADPLVWEPQWIHFHDHKTEWYLEASRLSVFLTSMICWQSVMGGLPYSAVKNRVEDSTIKKIEDNFEPVDFGEDNKEFRVFIETGKILCLSVGENDMNLQTAASDKNKLLEVSRLLSVQ